MTDARARSRSRRELADRLAVEYAGAVPPGQVLATVLRADRLLRSVADGTSAGWLTHCEAIARRALAESVARPARLAVVGAAS